MNKFMCTKCGTLFYEVGLNILPDLPLTKCPYDYCSCGTDKESVIEYTELTNILYSKNNEKKI